MHCVKTQTKNILFRSDKMDEFVPQSRLNEYFWISHLYLHLPRLTAENLLQAFLYFLIIFDLCSVLVLLPYLLRDYCRCYMEIQFIVFFEAYTLVIIAFLRSTHSIFHE